MHDATILASEQVTGRLELPSGWIVANDHDDTVDVLHEPSGRSLSAFEHPERPTTWRVIGLAEYGPDCPRLADRVTPRYAIRALLLEIEAVENGTPSAVSADDAHDYKVCENCEARWLRDPALEVACPSCGAGVGAACQRPSGHSGPLVAPHDDRTEAAIEAGFLSRRCGAAERDDVDPATVQENGTTGAQEDSTADQQREQAGLGRWA